jgi:primosomal protein N' (replication factor Y)
MVEWLKKSFPQANVIHSSSEERITQIEKGPNLVISTPGSEPEVPDGYRFVVLADAFSMVGAPKLRALERSLLFWANAAEKVAKDGVVIFVGLTDRLASHMAQLDFYTAMKEDFHERAELGLPPSRRIASVSSKSVTDLELLKQGLVESLADQITPIPVPELDRIVFCFSYADAAIVSSSLRSLLAGISAKSRAKMPGQRLFHVRMDDANAI